MNTLGFFETFFNNARYNGVIIMDKQGSIININEAFRLRFGYSPADLIGKNFEVLFTEKDREIKKPETELQTVLTDGAANDENYLVIKGNRDLADSYGVEVMRIYDHYRARFVVAEMAKKHAKISGTLQPNNKWTDRYFRKDSLHFRDRLRFVGK